jgi:hypothetical protein
LSQRYQLEKNYQFDFKKSNKCIICIPGNSQGSSWSWSYGSWIYNFLCNQCLSPLTLWVRIPLSRGIFDKILCYKVTACRWYYSGTPVSSTNKTDSHSDMIPYSNLYHILYGETCTYPCSTPVGRVLGRLIFFVVVIFHL